MLRQTSEEHGFSNIGRLLDDLLVVVGVELQLPDTVKRLPPAGGLPSPGVETHAELQYRHVPDTAVQAVAAVHTPVLQELECLGVVFLCFTSLAKFSTNIQRVTRGPHKTSHLPLKVAQYY